MFKTLVIPLAIIVVIGWAAYGAWKIINHYKEKNKPEQKTKHLENVKDSFDDYTRKLANYKKTPYERK